MEETEAINPEVAEESRMAAALAALEGRTQEVAEEVAEPQETAEENEEAEAGNGVPLDGDQPITPGEENVGTESSRLASLARRERKARENAKERDTRISARERELEERLGRAEALEKRLNSLKSSMLDDPVGTLRELGIEDGYGDVAGALYDEEMGDDAPDEWKSQRVNREMATRIRKLEREQADNAERTKGEKAEAETLAFQRQYAADITSFMDEAPDTLEFAKNFHTKNPGQAVQAMFGIALRMGEEDPQKIPAPSALAEDLNQELKELFGGMLEEMVAQRLASTKEAPQATEGRRPPRTLRNAQSTRTSTRPPAATEEERMKRAMAVLTRG